MKPNLAIILSCALLLTLCGDNGICAPGNPPKDIGVSYSIGAGKLPHMGRVNPIVVSVSNAGKSGRFTGTVQVAAGSTQYERSIDVAAGSTVTTTVFADFDPPPAFLDFRIKGANGRVLYSARENLKNPAAPEEPVVLVIDEKAGGLSYLEGTLTLTRRTTMYGSSAELLTPAKMRVCFAGLQELIAAGPQYLAPVDAVVFHDGDLAKMAEADVRGLMAFAAAGGLLVICPSVSKTDLASSELAALMPLPTSAIDPSSVLSQLAAFAGEPIPPDTQALVHRGVQLKSDAIILAGSTELPFVLEKDYGLGKIVQVNVDYEQPSLRSWPGWKRIWTKLFISAWTNASFEETALHPGNIAKKLKDIPQAKPVPPNVAGLFVVVYIILVGPANYLLLRKSKKRTFIWITIPAVVIAFAAFAIVLGYLSRGTQNILRQLDEVHIFPGIPVALYRSNVMYFSAFSRDCEIRFPGEGAALHASAPPPRSGNFGNPYYQPQQPDQGAVSATVKYRPAPQVDRRVNKWTPYNVWSDGFVGSNFGGIKWSDKNDGRLTASLPSKAGNAWLLSGKSVQASDGGIPKDGAVDLSSFSKTVAATMMPNNKLDIPAEVGELFSQRAQLPAFGQSGAASIAVLFDYPAIETTSSLAFTKGGNALVVYHLPKSAASDTSPNVSASVTDYQENSTGKNISPSGSYGYGANPGIMSLKAGDELEITFTVSPAEKVAKYQFASVAQAVYSWQNTATYKYEVAVTNSAGTLIIAKPGISAPNTNVSFPADQLKDGIVVVRIKAEEDTFLSDLSLTPTEFNRNSA